MNTAALARQDQLDAVTGQCDSNAELAFELFAVVDLLDKQPRLRNGLADLNTDDAARAQLAAGVFGTHLVHASEIVVAAAKLHWVSAAELVAALERQGVRAACISAQADGKLDQVADELFRFSRLVAGDRELQEALADRTVDVAARQRLIADLLDGKVHPITLNLAQRGLLLKVRTVEMAWASMLQIAAELQDKTVALVKVARPLTVEQRMRMTEILTKQFGKPLSLQVSVDENVLGGVLVRIGDEEIDGTVLERLNTAKKTIN
ncbi:MAG: F0F1 ATP synthase subunit delta [Propionibacteriaceae bacterium]|nr:F0F1 ATP synthase subunit delta [Propionibacteriaceae bacterium]